MAKNEAFAKHLGSLLKQRRVELGLSQTRVAGVADMTQDGLWMIEQGKRVPRADTLLKIMAALGMEGEPLTFFANVSWEAATDGLPGVQLVIKPSENGAMREYVKAA